MEADCLAPVVEKDWSGFKEKDELFLTVSSKVYEKVKETLIANGESDRKLVKREARAISGEKLAKIGPLAVSIWDNFIEQTQLECPSITTKDVVQLGVLLANLEQSRSQYSLLQRLSALSSQNLEDLDKILEDWTVDMAKIVLDELQKRLMLLAEMRSKINDPLTLEVQELQPLFQRGLWIFGPEFETISYTSNEGMTKVVQLLGGSEKGSRQRPDFAILTEGTAGLYSYPEYDDETGGEIGCAKLVIVELKKPDVKISFEQKSQCWKYVRELLAKGMVTDSTKVICFVLGPSIDPLETEEKIEGKNTRIVPLTYDIIIRRAETRLFDLEKRIKNAPFLKEHQDELESFVREPEIIQKNQPNLFSTPHLAVNQNVSTA